MFCKLCGNKFPNRVTINGVRHNIHNRKYCLQCLPFKSHIRIHVKSDTDKKNTKGKFNIINWNNMQELYNNGYTRRMLIQEFGLSEALISQAQKMGIFKTRNYSEAYRMAELNNRIHKREWTSADRLKLSKKKIALYNKHPEKHPNSKLAGNKSKMTFPEKIVAQLLDDNNIKYKHNAYVKPYWIDFLVGNIGIEIDGEYWHNKINDNIRDASIAINGIKIRRFRAKDILKNKEIVLSILQ